MSSARLKLLTLEGLAGGGGIAVAEISLLELSTAVVFSCSFLKS